MDFQEWLADGELLNEIKPFVERIKLLTLQSMRAVDGNLDFNFPKDYLSLLKTHPIAIRQPQIQSHPYQLAAWTDHGDLAEGWERDGGKGLVAYKAIEPSLANKKWSPDVVKGFQKTLGITGGPTSKLDKIGKELGLMFELEVFSHLVDLGLKTVGFSRMEAVNEYESLRNNLESEITPSAAKGVVDFLKIHADDLAKQMITKARTLLTDCRDITQVMFKGGSHGEFKLRTTTADIIIGCKIGKIGFSTKFSSESQMNLASLSPKQAYIMVARKMPSQKLLQKLEKLYNPKDMSEYMIGIMHEILDNYNPIKFAKLLNHLIVGKDNKFINLPAARFYTRNTGGAGFSSALKKDFFIDEAQIDSPLRAKPDAQISVQSNRTYVKIVYKRPPNKIDPGSWTGTYLIFEPSGTKINVKMNNLASTGTNGKGRYEG